jgi:tRNA(Ile)-lysidine synthase
MGTRSGLISNLPRYVAAHGLWSPGAHLLVAVSGGPDSLALLHLLWRLRDEQRLVLHVAHLDHRLRAGSAEDAAFVAATVAAWNIPATIVARDVAPLASGFGGIEAAARAVRYGFLRDTALQIGADAVVTGHNADDQAETVIQRLLRGAGPTGLAGMRPRLGWDHWHAIGVPPAPDVLAMSGRPALARPLLSTAAKDIRAYCAEHRLEPRVDETNRSGEFLRNRVRDHIIPLLKTYNSNIVGTLGRIARVCADEDSLLAELLDREWPELVTVETAQVRLDRAALARLHRALQRRALRRAVAVLAPGVEVGSDHLDRMALLLEQPRGRLQLPGALWMRLVPDAVFLERGAER